ncbi:MAG: tripartite tricarboxylate transporter TctB family protein [Rhodospirillales bacterium]|nr:tripartite tricarboxylate transporter TctB family protein [Rhodospirillales bacterium]
MTRILEICIPAVLLTAALAFFATTFTDAFDVPTFGGDVGPAFAPRGFLLVWIGLCFYLLIKALRSLSGDETSGINARQGVLAVLVVLATGFGMPYFGFLFTAIPAFFLFSLAVGQRNLPVVIPISVILPLSIWALFTFGFKLLLPRSPWFGTF